jgi:hypothetical protein
MPLRHIGAIEFPDAADSAFDHGAFDLETRRVFVAHTGRDRVEVIDHDRGRHIATLAGFPEAAGVAAEAGQVLIGRPDLAFRAGVGPPLCCRARRRQRAGSRLGVPTGAVTAKTPTSQLC